MPQKQPSTVETALQVMREAGTPLTFDELLAAVNAVARITSRDPKATLRSALNNIELIQRIGDGRLVYVPHAATGNVLRVPLSAEDLQQQRLLLTLEARAALWPASYESTQKRQDRGPRTFTLANGETFTAPLSRGEKFEDQVQGGPALGKWLKSLSAAPGDAVLIHILDGVEGRVRLDFEPRSDRDEDRIAGRNRDLADQAYEVCQASLAETWKSHLVLRLIARGAYADPHPPDPLFTVLSEQDDRFVVGEFGVTLAARQGRPDYRPTWGLAEPPVPPMPLFPPVSGRVPLEEFIAVVPPKDRDELAMLLGVLGCLVEQGRQVYVDIEVLAEQVRDLQDQGIIPTDDELFEAGFTFPMPGAEAPARGRRSGARGRRRERRRRRQLAQQVYVFKAAPARRQGRGRRIEIGGDQTLGDLDRIMRDAFDLDPWDHLSEFYMGGGRDGNRHGLGVHQPDGGGEGDAVILGDVGLQVGDTLRYVYDFGDYIEHVLTLEKITTVDPAAEYPRLVD
jgi:hypothetical protein